MRATKTNIRKVMAACTADDIAEGMSWYVEAYALACRLTPANPAMGAGVLAAFSPMTSWAQNVKRAETFITTGTVGATGDSIRKATRIMAGEAPLDVLGGPKVRSFYTDIMGLPNETVTVDRHAIDISVGKPLKDAQRASMLKGKGYATLARFYSDVAREYDVTPAQLQAITWVWWRKNRAAAFHG